MVRGLGQLGYEALPLPVSAEDIGAPHRRARIFVVARRVPDPVGESQWHEQQRLAQGRAGGVRDPWTGVARDVGGQVADGYGEHGSAWQGRHARAERAGWPELGRGDETVANTLGLGEQQPHAATEAQRGGELQGSAPQQRGGALAHDHDHGLEEVGLRGEVKGRARGGGGDLPAYGYDAHGRCGAWPWPPGPGDLDGWREYLAQGGPVPALLRRSDGLPCGMARKEWGARLKAYGNAVVPVCAEVAGWVIRELDGF